MEKRKNSLSALKICRFCLCQDETLTSLYDRIRKPKNATSLSLKILSCLSMEVFPSDNMPAYICQQCNFFMDLMYNYKDMCRRADEKIMQYVQRGSALDSMSWPTSLSKVYRLGLKTNRNLIQLTSQEVSDSEEEENNVYNIKIGDGTEEGADSIQLIASKGEDMDKIKPAKEILSCEADSEEEDAKDAAETDGLWPCDECDCTYPLRQLLHLHKKQKHRARNVACEQCDAKFFSKYDLQMHMVRHSDEMLFQCVACDRRFKRLVLLKRHEKIMHSDIPQLACPNCPATFLSLEELTAHQKIHNRYTDLTVSCHLCNKKFVDQNTRSRHMKVVHPHHPSFHCEYCPAQFSTIANLVRHVRSHAGDRPYPCRHCDKKFTKSHHYTRHLRDKHRVPEKRAREERYRCEQCEESFFSQDELIYHSAIHATQNLTCPLCQEKFEDVDAVTAHIKSHVNGTEFMCDLCELVFTSKEKLDGHLTLVHSEELDNDESSIEMEVEDDEDDNTINVKEEDGQMVVEIKKSDGFMLAEPPTNVDVKPDVNVNSEESEPESTYTELPTVDTLAIVRKKPAPAAAEEEPVTAPMVMGSVTITKVTPKTAEPVATAENVTASILRKAEEVKRKAQQISSEPVAEKKVLKVESSTAGASDKSLRLLEKELQELKRTNPRNEVSKTPVRSMETLRNRRPQLHTSTPKTRATEEKKLLAATKSPATDKKVPDRPERSERPERKAVTKENKEPKETKEIKEIKSTPVKEEKKKEEEVKEKETPKSVVKNGTSDKSQPEETVRRSTRPSKIKDYAKMIRDKSQESDEDSDDADDEEYKEVEKTESRAKTRRSSIKTPKAAAPAPPAPAAAAPPRKRGRPRKDQSAQKEVPPKMKKEEPEEEEEAADDKMETEVSKPAEPAAEAEKNAQSSPTPTETAENAPAGNEANQSPSSEQKSAAGGVLVSPTGQTLKKVPIKALPPGVKPLPLPSRPLGTGELCEMQIGKKMVKVQKIVMTKAEVEAMAKKGLLEMKDGTMVLKQGIKLPTPDTMSLKALVGDKEGGKESPSKTEK